MIQLGDKVKDIISGYVGIAVAKTEFINGCIQYTLTSRVGKDNKLSSEEFGIDETSLIVIEKDFVGKQRKILKKKIIKHVIKDFKKKSDIKKVLGGANKLSIKQRGY